MKRISYIILFLFSLNLHGQISIDNLPLPVGSTSSAKDNVCYSAVAPDTLRVTKTGNNDLSIYSCDESMDSFISSSAIRMSDNQCVMTDDVVWSYGNMSTGWYNVKYKYYIVKEFNGTEYQEEHDIIRDFYIINKPTLTIKLTPLKFNRT